MAKVSGGGVGRRGEAESGRDAEEFGAVVDALVGRRCARSLATDSIKLRFGVERDPRGTHYVWIDPPWALYAGDALVTTSEGYDPEAFAAWSRLLAPLDDDVLAGWTHSDDGAASFAFASGCRIELPPHAERREPDGWYTRWYARDRGA